MLNCLVSRVRAVVAVSLLVLSLAIAPVRPVQASPLVNTVGTPVATILAVAEAPADTEEPLTAAELEAIAAKEAKEAAKLEAKKLKEEKKLEEKAEKAKLKEAKKAAKLEAKKLKEQQEAEEEAAKAEAKKLKDEEKMALKQAKEEAKAALLMEMEAAE